MMDGWKMSSNEVLVSVMSVSSPFLVEPGMDIWYEALILNGNGQGYVVNEHVVQCFYDLKEINTFFTLNGLPVVS